MNCVLGISRNTEDHQQIRIGNFLSGGPEAILTVIFSVVFHLQLKAKKALYLAFYCIFFILHALFIECGVQRNVK